MSLSLREETVPNDGYILASEIGEGNAGLHCNTNRMDCCRGADHPNEITQGQWYLPGGTQVGSHTQEVAVDPSRNFFYRNRDTGVVRLNRIGSPPERGQFRCEVANAAGDDVTVYVNIGEW